ncbi:MAG: T9SS type A sorting domain-containing protein [Chitinophagaceae bacterium]|nr:T9SS type A sorting domain-containing protein [Chitinophagaceae bacterium]
MTQKILLSLLAFTITAGIIGSSLNTATSNGSGAPSGNTGSPSDNKTCAQNNCHPGTATAIFDVITSNVPLEGYEPGSTYTITATVTDPSLVKFGFEISPQSSTGTILGTMALIDANKTKFTTTSNKYITHKSGGTSFPGHTATWSFSWTAPIAGTGAVTFYGAFNFSNNNNNTSGDVIHTSTLTIPESFGVGIDETGDLAAFNIYPNPAANEVHLTYSLDQPQQVVVSLFSLSGKMIGVLQNESQASGIYHPSFPMEGYAKGVYILELQAGEKSVSRKIIKL